MASPTPGLRLGPYELLSRIGAGGMGEVWRARDTCLNRMVAVKFSREKYSAFERQVPDCRKSALERMWPSYDATVSNSRLASS